MYKYTPLAESDSTEAQTMHGVRLAVACGVHCKHAEGSLKVRGVRITAVCMHTHTHTFPVARCRKGYQCERYFKGKERDWEHIINRPFGVSNRLQNKDIDE